MVKLTKGYKTGKAQPVWKCAREIRICAPNKLGEIYTCYNEGEIEQWMCIKVNKNYNYNIMQQVYQ